MMNLQRREEIRKLVNWLDSSEWSRATEYQDAMREMLAHIDTLEQMAAERVIAGGKAQAVVVPEPDGVDINNICVAVERKSGREWTGLELSSVISGISETIKWVRKNSRAIPADRALVDGMEAVSREEWDEVVREISAWRDATKADERTKALHIGEYHLGLTVVDDEGEEAPWNVPVPWVVVKDIMEAIRADKNKLCALLANQGGAAT